MFKKVHESRLRRMAKRQRLRLVKSRRRDPDATEFGAYWLEPEAETDRSSWRGPDLYFNLDQVEAALTDWRKRNDGDA